MSPNEPTETPTSRSNSVSFTDITKTIISMTWDGTLVVSAGQPFTPPPTITPDFAPDSNGFTIELQAGRQDTSAVATQFNALCGSADNMYTTQSFVDRTPSELNFFFGMTFMLSSGSSTLPVTVYIAQGSTGWTNNWWLGGECISYTGFFTAVVGGNQVKLSMGPNGNAGFVFEPGD